MKENDFLRIRFDVFPTNPSGESEATGNPTFPSNGRNLTCLAAENQLQERNAHEFASRIPSTVPGACTLICSPAFARRYAFAQQLFMRKIRMRERGTERALTGCLVRYAKGAPIPQTPHESSYRKEDSMRNRLLATTAAILVGMTFAAAQNMPNAQSERGSAGADRQPQGREQRRKTAATARKVRTRRVSPSRASPSRTSPNRAAKPSAIRPLAKGSTSRVGRTIATRRRGKLRNVSRVNPTRASRDKLSRVRRSRAEASKASPGRISRKRRKGRTRRSKVELTAT